MKRAFVTAVGVATLCLSGAFIAPAATAATSHHTSASHTSLAAAKLYVYRNDNCDRTHGYYGFSKTDSNFKNNTWIGAANSVNDGASSMKNNTSRAAVLYADSGYSGRTYYAKAHSQDNDLTNNGFDNKASSLKFQ